MLRIAEKLGFQTVMMVEVCKNQPTLVFTPKINLPPQNPLKKTQKFLFFLIQQNQQSKVNFIVSQFDLNIISTAYSAKEGATFNA